MSVITQALGASEIAAILGLSPWTTAYEIWARKTGRLVEDKQSKAIEAGRRLEEAVLDWAEEHLGPIQRCVECLIPGTPIVCHPDGLTQDHQPVEAKTSGITGPLYGEWGEPGTDEIPDYYLVQALVQLEATKGDLCYVPALLGGRGFQLFRVLANKALQAEIIERALHWWREHVEKDKPPQQTTPPPLEVLKRLRRTPKKTVEIAAELVEAWLQAKQQARQAAQAADEAQAALIAALGDAEAGLLPDGRMVTYFEQFRKGYVVTDTTFRVLRIRS